MLEEEILIRDLIEEEILSGGAGILEDGAPILEEILDHRRNEVDRTLAAGREDFSVTEGLTEAHPDLIRELDEKHSLMGHTMTT